MLHLVDDDDAGEVPERDELLVQPGQADGIFEVEVVGRVGGNQLPRQGGLAALPRPDDGDDGGASERARDPSLRGTHDQVACHWIHDNTHEK